jgi:hypothetical protein
MTQREETGFNVWKEKTNVTTGPASFQQVQMSQLTIQRTCGNSEKWLVPELLSVRMIDVTITPDTSVAECQCLDGRLQDGRPS